MTLVTRKLKLSIALILGALSIFAVVMSGSGRSAQAAEPVTFNCPTYELRYNAKAGNINFPKGIYAITLDNQEKIVCPYALKNFKDFIQNVHNKIPSNWVKKTVTEGDGDFAVTTTTFKRGKKSQVSFSVAATLSPSLFEPAVEPKACKGKYKIKRTKRMFYRKPFGPGTVNIPKGNYRIAAINSKKFSCNKSKKKLNQFLKRGRVANSWKPKPALATFYKKSDRKSGFYITKNRADKG